MINQKKGFHCQDNVRLGKQNFSIDAVLHRSFQRCIQNIVRFRNRHSQSHSNEGWPTCCQKPLIRQWMCYIRYCLLPPSIPLTLIWLSADIDVKLLKLFSSPKRLVTSVIPFTSACLQRSFCVDRKSFAVWLATIWQILTSMSRQCGGSFFVVLWRVQWYRRNEEEAVQMIRRDAKS